MLNIKITGGNPSTGNLEFDDNGKPGNGNGEAKRNEQVHWIVMPGTPVDSIVGVRMKASSGTDIFSSNPPGPDGGDSKQWKATVDEDAPLGDFYYDIMWKSGKEVKIHDPKITVKPS